MKKIVLIINISSDTLELKKELFGIIFAGNFIISLSYSLCFSYSILVSMSHFNGIKFNWISIDSYIHSNWIKDSKIK